MTTAELVSYYANLLIMQYINKGRARATISAYVGEAVADQLIQSVADAFNLDNAIGAQLDTLGTYRGANRVLYGLDLGKTYFNFRVYGAGSPGSGVGFALYGDTVNWYFRLYQDALNPNYTLNDGDFRTYIKYLADIHSMEMVMPKIDALLIKYFGNAVILQDNMNMTVTFNITGATPTLFLIAQYVGALPRPAGVAIV
jgi:hypothetical protein